MCHTVDTHTSQNLSQIISNIRKHPIYLCRSTRGKGKYTESKIDEASRSAVGGIDAEIDTAIDANQEFITGGFA